MITEMNSIDYLNFYCILLLATITMADWQEWFLMDKIFGALQSQSSTYKAVQRSISIFKKWLQSWNENGRN